MIDFPRAEPESVGMSSERLGRIAPVLRAAVEAGQLPGAVIAVARQGKLVLHEAVTFWDRTGRCRCRGMRSSRLRP